MTTAPTTTPERSAEHAADFDAAFDAVRHRGARIGSDWLNALRHRAAAAFHDLGLPTTKHEEWRFTNLKPLRDSPFTLAADAAPAAVTADDIAPLLIDDLDAHRLVFVDGRVRDDLSDRPAFPTEARGPMLVELAEPVRHGCELTQGQVGSLADVEADAFAALNTALFEDAMLIDVPEGMAFDKPIHLLSVTTARAEPTMTHPRLLIRAGRGASVEVIEQYATLGDGVTLTNAVTELFADDEAKVHHYLLARECERAFNVSSLHIRQGEASDVHSHTALLGGAINRNNVHPRLDGERAHCLINGLFVGHGDQHHDNHMRVEHNAPNGDSRQFYKGILTDKAHGVFSGRIRVAPGAQQTDAKQTNRNLLLSDDARVNAKPQLEIYADDVKCTHGATTGQIDEEMVFYLRSRGIDRETARAMMIFAFAAETFERIELKPIEALLRREMIARLPMAAKLVDLL